MKWTTSIVAASLIAMCAGAAARSGGSIGNGAQMDRTGKMDAKDVT